MNKDILAGQWTELKGQIKSRWGRLTDDDFMRLEGHHEELAGVLQKRYGLAREQASKDSKEFLETHANKTKVTAAAQADSSADCSPMTGC